MLPEFRDYQSQIICGRPTPGATIVLDKAIKRSKEILSSRYPESITVSSMTANDYSMTFTMFEGGKCVEHYGQSQTKAS